MPAVAFLLAAAFVWAVGATDVRLLVELVGSLIPGLGRALGIESTFHPVVPLYLAGVVVLTAAIAFLREHGLGGWLPGRVAQLRIARRLLRSGLAVVVQVIGTALLIRWLQDGNRDQTAVTGGSLISGLCVLAWWSVQWRRLGRRRGGGGAPQPGQIWWATIPFEETSESKDRPCLVLRADGDCYSVLMLTSQDKTGRAGYVPVYIPGVHARGGKKISWLRLDRVIDRSRSDFRRFGWSADARTWAAARGVHRNLCAA